MGCARLLLATAVFAMASLAAPVGAQPPPADTDPPILRHSAPSAPAIGETLVIQAVVDDAGEVTRVTVWFRPVGGGEFQAVEASKRDEGQRLYEAGIELTSAFQDGLEYYVDATDAFGNRGTDGSDTVPYLVEVRALPALSGLATGSEAQGPWWKRRWVWVAAVVVMAASVAIAANRNDETGTVVVE